jgi:Tfp pilus assembly protein PilF
VKVRLIRAIVGVLSFAAVLPPLAALPDVCKAPTPIFSEAQHLEAEGHFPEAYQHLQPCESALSSAERQHFANLRALVVTERLSAGEHVQFAGEQAKSLRQAIAKLDPIQDATLLPYAYRLLDNLDTTARGFPATGFAQMGWHAWMSLSKRDWLDFPALLVLALLVGLLILAPWSMLRSPRYEISFQDLTGVAAQPNDRGDKHIETDSHQKLLDRILTQDLQQAFWIPRFDSSDQSMDDLHIETINNQDGASFGSLLPQTTLMPWANLVQGRDRVEVMSLKVSLRPIWLLLSWLFRRRTRKLVGYLHSHDQQIALTAQLLTQRYKTIPLRSWNIVAATPAERSSLIRDLAAQILVDLELSKVTNNWRSYRCFVEGHDLIAQGGGSLTSCKKATTHFHQALKHDPQNWMARFYLAIALRRRGENELTVDHLDLLHIRFKSADDSLAAHWWTWKYWRPWLEWKGWLDWRGWWYRKGWLRATSWTSWKRPDFLRQHLRRYPHCPFLVLYNKAMALAKCSKPDGRVKALQLLYQLLLATENNKTSWDRSGFPYSASKLSRQDRQRFHRLALCAQATIWAQQCEVGRESSEDGKSLLSWIEAACKDAEGETRKGNADLIASPGTKRNQTTLTPFDQAVTWNALGIAQQAMGDPTAALECFTKAATFPDLVDSFVNIASLCIGTHRPSECWNEKAREALHTALELDNNNPKARYWLARLEWEENDPLKHEKAIAALAGAQELPEACFLKAEIQYDNRKTAIQSWRRGLAQLSAPSSETVTRLEKLWTVMQPYAADLRVRSLLYQTAKLMVELIKNPTVQIWRDQLKELSRMVAPHS